MITVALVSTLQPETHYTRYLARALQKDHKDLKLILYTDVDPSNTNRKLQLQNVKQVWRKGPNYIFQIIKQVRKDNPDIVHLQQEMNMYGRPLTAVLFPVLIFILKCLRKKIVITFHAAPSPDEIDFDFLRTFSYPENNLTLHAARFAFRYLYWTSQLFCDHIIVHSNYIKNILVTKYGVTQSKITPIHIGANNLKIKKQTSHLGEDIEALIKGKKIILFFGFILKRKGLEYLIDAFSKLHKQFPDYVVIFAGGTLNYQNFYMLDLQKRIRNLELTHRILFTGFLNELQIQRLYRDCRFLVLPYTYSISSSLPLTFAIQYHKPVIATNIGSLKEEIQDGKDGLLCRPRDVTSLSKCMKKVMEDSNLYRKLVSGMRHTHRERTWSATANNTYLLYQNLGSNKFL